MERLYTHTTWQVKAGQEDEFVRDSGGNQSAGSGG